MILVCVCVSSLSSLNIACCSTAVGLMDISTGNQMAHVIISSVLIFIIYFLSGAKWEKDRRTNSFEWMRDAIHCIGVSAALRRPSFGGKVKPLIFYLFLFNLTYSR